MAVSKFTNVLMEKSHQDIELQMKQNNSEQDEIKMHNFLNHQNNQNQNSVASNQEQREKINSDHKLSSTTNDDSETRIYIPSPPPRMKQTTRENEQTLNQNEQLQLNQQIQQQTQQSLKPNGITTNVVTKQISFKNRTPPNFYVRRKRNYLRNQ